MSEYAEKESAIYMGSESFICEIRILGARFEFLKVDLCFYVTEYGDTE